MSSAAPPAARTSGARPVQPELYFNRELSWLDFNARVLREAIDERVPLLERVKFLAIFSSNLDEFFMVRVAGLKRQLAAGVTQPSPDGLTPPQQLEAIARRVANLMETQQATLADLLDLLGAQDVRLVDVESLSGSEFSSLDEYFERHVFPVLTPLAL